MRRVRKLLEVGEISRAVAAAYPRGMPGEAVDDYRALQQMFPKASAADRARLAGSKRRPPLPGDVRQRVEDAVPWVITHFPKRSGCGPTDSRFEHWATLKHDDDGMALAAKVLVRLLLGEAPTDAVAASGIFDAPPLAQVAAACASSHSVVKTPS